MNEIEEAIAYYEEQLEIRGDDAFIQTSMRWQIVLEALRAQLERDNPQPLSLDELREMDGESIYIVRVEADKEYFNKISNGWYINFPTGQHLLRGIDYINYGDIFDGMIDTMGGRVKFGYNAYRYKPKEAKRG